VSVDVTLHEPFTIHCSATSTHSFYFAIEVTVLDEHVFDPVAGNSADSVELTVNAIAYADVKIIDQMFVSPPSSIPVSTDVPVTLRKVLHNNGALPVTVTVTKTATAPADCTITPLTHSEQVPLPPSVDTPVDETFTIRCLNPSSHSFQVKNVVSGPKEAHIVDLDRSSNVASTVLPVAALGQADIKVNGVSANPPVTKAAPTVAYPVTAKTNIHNNGPMIAETAKTVTVSSPANPAENQCSINGGMVSSVVIVNAAPETDLVSVDRVESDNFTIDLPAGKATCTFKITSSKSLTGVHMGDPVPGNNSASGDGLVCRDRDTLLCPGPSPCPDTVSDPEASAENALCGPADNCPDHYNPDQTDTDGNGKGDVCDTTPDHDVTVKSLLLFGPAPVNLGDTTGRYIWAIGEIGNLRDHVETVDLRLNIVGNPGCNEDIQSILPGRNPFTLMDLEQKWVLVRTRYECHSPSPGIYPLTITLVIDHVAHPDGGDDTYPGNDSQTRTKSLLLE